MHFEQWSKSEKRTAREAFEKAYERECSAIADIVRQRAAKIAEPSDIWALHDFLTRRRKDTDEKYDYRYSVLIVVFARLIRERWLDETELAGLSEDKLKRIRSILEL